MTYSLGDIIKSHNFSEPEEIRIIKNFVQEHFKSSVSVSVQKSHIIIEVPNAALAGTLRLHSHQLAKACQTDKRLVIRIS
jgi:hypothetical protein